MSFRVILTDAQNSALLRGRSIRVDLGKVIDFDTRTNLNPYARLKSRTAIVVRMRLGDSYSVRAFANVCRHRPVPLDAPGTIESSDDGVTYAPTALDGFHILCHSHGALYRPKDGQCVSGPCIGESLVSIDVDDAGGEIALVIHSD